MKLYFENLRIKKMTRRCTVTGKATTTGNNVSHANNRTRRRFLPNLQETSAYSEVLKKSFKMRLSVNGIRTLEHKGGFDAYLLDTAPTKLDPSLRKVKAQVEAAVAAQQAKA